MDAHKYLNAKGEVVLAVVSSVPGLTIVPPGMDATQSLPMTLADFDKHVKDSAAANPVQPEVSVKDLAKQIATLTKQLLSVQADLQKVIDKQK